MTFVLIYYRLNEVSSFKSPETKGETFGDCFQAAVMVGVAGAEDGACGRARLRHPHLPRAPAAPETMEEARAVQEDQGI